MVIVNSTQLFADVEFIITSQQAARSLIKMYMFSWLVCANVDAARKVL